MVTVTVQVVFHVGQHTKERLSGSLPAGYPAALTRGLVQKNLRCWINIRIPNRQPFDEDSAVAPELQGNFVNELNELPAITEH